MVVHKAQNLKIRPGRVLPAKWAVQGTPRRVAVFLAML
ncbi:unnamed protein product, partial [marine sediment metagenome]